MNRRGARPVSAWIGMAVGALGTVLIASAIAVTIHASDAPRFDAGDRYQVTRSGPIHVVTIGSAAATCVLTGSASLETIEVPPRAHPLDSIPAGKHLWADLGADLTCDRQVAISDGPAVRAYAVATSQPLFGGYAALAILGLVYFLRRGPGHPRRTAPENDVPKPAPAENSTGLSLGDTVSRAVAVRPEPSAVVDPAHGTSSQPTEHIFPVEVDFRWVVLATVPVSAMMAALVSLCLVVSLLMPLSTSAPAPSAWFFGYLALLGLPFAVRIAWVAYRIRREWRRSGPPRLEVDVDGLTVLADRRRTRIPWPDIAWLTVTTGIPPRRNAPTLVVGPSSGASLPPVGYRWIILHWYEPHPRWYPHLRVVRVFDLALLSDQDAVVTAILRYAAGKWRPTPMGGGDRPGSRARTEMGELP